MPGSCFLSTCHAERSGWGLEATFPPAPTSSGHSRRPSAWGFQLTSLPSGSRLLFGVLPPHTPEFSWVCVCAHARVCVCVCVFKKLFTPLETNTVTTPVSVQEALGFATQLLPPPCQGLHLHLNGTRVSGKEKPDRWGRCRVGGSVLLQPGSGSDRPAKLAGGQEAP